MYTNDSGRQLKKYYRHICRKIECAYPLVSKELVQDACQDSVVKCYEKYGNFYISASICKNQLIDKLRHEQKTLLNGITDLPDTSQIPDNFSRNPFTLEELLGETEIHSVYGTMLKNVIQDFIECNKPSAPKSPMERKMYVAGWVYLQLNPPMEATQKKNEKINIPHLIAFCRKKKSYFTDTAEHSSKNEQYTVHRLIRCFKDYCREHIEHYYESARISSEQNHYAIGYNDYLSSPAPMTDDRVSFYRNPFLAIHMNVF